MTHTDTSTPRTLVETLDLLAARSHYCASEAVHCRREGDDAEADYFTRRAAVHGRELVAALAPIAQGEP